MKNSILVFIFILSGCSSTQLIPFEYSWAKVANNETQKTIYLPEIGKTSEARIGNTLVSKSTVTYKDAIKINKDFKIGFNSTGSINGFNNKVITVNDTEDLIFPNHATFKNKKTNQTMACFENIAIGDIYSSYIKDTFSPCLIDDKEMGYFREILEKDNPNTPSDFLLPLDIDYEKIVVKNTTGYYFKQEFIFNGRVDNSLKFIYREFNGDLARPSFTQEVQYDLNQSNIIGFKDLSIEILNATNQEIEYKVITPF